MKKLKLMFARKQPFPQLFKTKKNYFYFDKHFQSNYYDNFIQSYKYNMKFRNSEA